MRIENLSVEFDGLVVFDNFNVSFERGAINCVMGPSGCGKTTLLNFIARLLPPSATQQTPGDAFKSVGYIFQEPRLLPWYSVLDNILIAMPDSMNGEEKRLIAERFLDMVGLSRFKDFLPEKLSGGMRQRASLARAFSCPGDVLLMDEPFSGQDLRTKRELIGLFLQLMREKSRTVIAVTHDFEEAWAIGKKIILLSPAPSRLVFEAEIAAPQENRYPDRYGDEANSLRLAVEAVLAADPDEKTGI